MVVWSIAMKEEAKNVMFWSKKDISKVKNTLLQWIFQNILENQTFQKIVKFIMVDFYEMDFMNAIVVLVKVDETCNILKSTSHCLLVERWKWNWMINVFAVVCPWKLLRPSFIKGCRFHYVRYTVAEKEFDIKM